MSDSILITIKKMLGIPEDNTAFDTDIIININTVFFQLYQIGVGPEGYSISDSSTTWEDYLGEEIVLLEGVKTYIYLKVRMAFDPPTIGGVIDAYKNQISELEWRLNIAVDDQSGGDDDGVQSDSV